MENTARTESNKITLWYRIENGKPYYNHMDYTWIKADRPNAISSRQNKAWENVIWEKRYGYLVDGKVEEI